MAANSVTNVIEQAKSARERLTPWSPRGALLGVAMVAGGSAALLAVLALAFRGTENTLSDALVPVCTLMSIRIMRHVTPPSSTTGLRSNSFRGPHPSIRPSVHRTRPFHLFRGVLVAPIARSLEPIRIGDLPPSDQPSGRRVMSCAHLRLF